MSHPARSHAVTPPTLLLQWKVLQAGGPHANVGKTLARIDRRLAASHRDPHLHALRRQREEGPVRLGHEGRQRRRQRPSEGVRFTSSLVKTGPCVFLCADVFPCSSVLIV